MRNTLLAIPIVALLLLGAHHLRQGEMGLMAAHVLLVGLFTSRQAWIRLVIAVVLGLGVYEWAWTGIEFVKFRMALGAPWGRLAVIMAGVLLFNFVAMMSMFGTVARKRFHQNENSAPWQVAIFGLVVSGLWLTQMKTPFPILLVDRFFPGWGGVEILVLGVYAAWLGGRMLDPRKALHLRPRIWALFSLIFFAQLILGMAGVEEMLMTGNLHLPVPALIVGGPAFRGAGFFMPILFSITIVLVGPAWCSHLCYIGAWDDLLSRNGPRPRHSETLGRWVVAGRIATLLLVLVTGVGLRLAGASPAVAVLLAAAFGLAGVGIMLFHSRRSGMMVHCSAYCPIGILGNVLGRISPWRIYIGQECDACGACFTRCRYNALSENTVVTGQAGLSCTLCGDCVSACRNRQIRYGFPGLSPTNARALFLTLVISLHAIFLGVARI